MKIFVTLKQQQWSTLQRKNSQNHQNNSNYLTIVNRSGKGTTDPPIFVVGDKRYDTMIINYVDKNDVGNLVGNNEISQKFLDAKKMLRLRKGRIRWSP